MSTVVAVADWIKRLADDERSRDAVRLAEEELAARKAAMVRLHGRRLIDELHAVVVRDVGTFRNEFANDRARDIVLDDTTPDGGFAVHKTASPPVSLTLTPHLGAGVTVCQCRFTPAGGLPPREDRFELVFAEDGAGVLQMKHNGTGRIFATVDALSEFLLVPVFTGRPR